MEREAELRTADQLLESVRAGVGQTFVVEGPAGIGKTTLLSAIAAKAALLDVPHLAAAGSPVDTDIPFGVAKSVFGAAVRRDRAGSLAGSAAYAAPLFNQSGTAQVDAVVHGLYWLTCNLSQDRPLLITVDDAQWADVESLRAIAYLSRRIDSVPVLLCVATRPDASDAHRTIVERMAVDPLTWVTDLPPLSPAGASELCALAVGAEVDRGLANACHEVTGGNPFYLQALLADAPATADEARSLGPSAVRQFAQHRLDSCGLEHRAVAEVVGVLGDAAPPGRVASLAGIDLTRVSVIADDLGRADILQRGQRLAFAHSIVRQAVLDATPIERLSDLNRRAASLLEGEGAGALLIAAHLLSCQPAGDPWVVDKLEEAADEALRSGSTEAAATYLARAVQEGQHTARRRRNLLLRLARVEAQIPRESCVMHFEEVLSETSDPVERARMSLELAPALGLVAADPQAAVELLESAIQQLPDGELHLRRELLICAVGQARLDARLRGRVEELLRLLQSELVSPPPTSHQQFALHVHLARDANVRGLPVATTWGHLDAALASMTEPVTTEVYQSPLANAIVTLIYAGRPAEGAALARQMEAAARETGNLHMMALALQYQAFASWRDGDVRRLEVDARRSLELLEEGSALRGQALGLLVEALIERDLADEAWDWLKRSGLASPDVTARTSTQLVLEARARLHLAVDDPASALTDALAVGKVRTSDGCVNPDVTHWRSIASLALHRLGRHKEAVALAEETLRLAQEVATERAVGSTLRTLGVVSAQVEHLEQSVEILTPSAAPLELMRSLLALGTALRTHGRRLEARTPLRLALDLSSKAGVSSLARAARAELVGCGARPRRMAITGIDALTPSERRVAELAAEGMSNLEIAQSQFLTVKTVEGHLRKAFRKLSITSRKDLPAHLQSGREG